MMRKLAPPAGGSSGNPGVVAVTAVVDAAHRSVQPQQLADRDATRCLHGARRRAVGTDDRPPRVVVSRLDSSKAAHAGPPRPLPRPRPRLPSRLVPVSFLDPRSPVDGGRGVFDELPLRPIPSRPTIGLLANGFPGSAQFLDAVATEIATTVEGVSFERVTKVSPPTPLTEAQLALLTTCRRGHCRVRPLRQLHLGHRG